MAQYTEQIREWLLASEGTRYVDHPSDPGGATRHGVTRKTLARWRGVSPWWDLPKSEVRSLTIAEASEIMRANYWDVVQADKLPAGLDYAVFDYAVNSGPGRAVKDLQRVLGNVKVDGIVGLETLDAIRSRDVPELIIALCLRRYDFVRGLRTFATFGRGWTRRIMGEKMGAQPGRDIGVIDRAVMLANGSDDIPSPVPPSRPEDVGKAEPESNTIVDAIRDHGVQGLGLGGAAGLLGAISDNPIVSVAVAIAIVVGVGIGAFYLIRRIRREDPA